MSLHKEHKASALYLYGSNLGPSPYHIYQGKTVSANFVHYSKFSYMFKRYSLVLSEGFRPMLLGSLIKRGHLVRRHINIMLGDFISSIGRNPIFKELVDSAIYKGVDGFISNSTLSAEFFLRIFGDKYLHRIKVCWPTLTNGFQSSDSVTYSISNGKKLSICSFLYLSYLDGADLLPEIFQKVYEEVGPSISMYVISSSLGDCWREFIEKAKKLSDKGFKVFLSSKPFPYSFIKNVFSKCKVFVYPARLKMFGIPVLEAMSQGLIPIVTNTTGARDFAKKVDPSLVVPLNTTLIAKRIIDVLSMKTEDLHNLSLKAKEISLNWSLYEAKKRYIRILNELLNHNTS